VPAERHSSGRESNSCYYVFNYIRCVTMGEWCVYVMVSKHWRTAYWSSSSSSSSYIRIFRSCQTQLVQNTSIKRTEIKESGERLDLIYRTETKRAVAENRTDRRFPRKNRSVSDSVIATGRISGGRLGRLHLAFALLCRSWYKIRCDTRSYFNVRSKADNSA